jgi:hypothetical protein
MSDWDKQSPQNLVGDLNSEEQKSMSGDIEFRGVEVEEIENEVL